MYSTAAGALSGKGKIPYAILGLLDVMRHYPGQVSPPTPPRPHPPPHLVSNNI